jgi:flavin-dependent dehydrogenase
LARAVKLRPAIFASLPPADLFDTAIIGAGPAGSAAARLLSLWGHRVVLVSRTPPKQALAESLPPSCTKLLDKIGVREDIERAPFVRATGNTVHWAGQPTRVESFADDASGFQVDRNAFDAVMRRAAVTAGAHVVTGTVHGITRGEDARAIDESRGELWRISFHSDGVEQSLKARWVFDCTGRAGLLARRGLRRPEPHGRTMALVGVWEREDAWNIADATHTVVESYDGGWAWSVPVDDRRRFVTVMVDPGLTAMPSRSQLGSAYHAELARTSALSGLVRDARLAEQPFACEASGYSAERFASPGMMLVGDAGSFVDPLSSFGVKKALASAWLAAVVVRTCIEDSSMQATALEFFETRERTMYETLQRRTKALWQEAETGHSTNFWRDRAEGGVFDADDALDVDALRTDPRVLAAFAELKRRSAVRFGLSPFASVVKRPTVEGNRVVLADHLATPAMAGGVRYLRNIDLMVLTRLARDCNQVPELFEAYNRAAHPAALPDFLGALSVLVAFDVLAVA